MAALVTDAGLSPDEAAALLAAGPTVFPGFGALVHDPAGLFHDRLVPDPDVP